MNLKIKYRESFRPFAPSVLAERVSDYFELVLASPYMLVVAPVCEDLRIEATEEQRNLLGTEGLNTNRLQLPTIPHVDYSARVQTVHDETNPMYFKLHTAFNELSDCWVLANTSPNVRREPILCTPEDAYRCLMRTEIDYLAIENFFLSKDKQPAGEEDVSWRGDFELD